MAGKKLVTTLVNCLWYIDGRTHVLTKQGCKLPDFVLSFTGYNKPEISKHRKRKVENMCASILRSHSSALFGFLQSTYWNRSKFTLFKPPIPSLEWIRLQFWPKSPQSKQSCHYTGRLDIKFAVQRRQWRLQHEDAHYAAALFRERESAIKFRDNCIFACLDDKHRIKIGDPGSPLAAN